MNGHTNAAIVAKHLRWWPISGDTNVITVANDRSFVTFVPNDSPEMVIWKCINASTPANDCIRVNFANDDSPIRAIWMHTFAYTPTVSRLIVPFVIRISINCDIWSDTWKFMRNHRRRPQRIQLIVIKNLSDQLTNKEKILKLEIVRVP